MRVRYAFVDSPLGRLFVATTPAGVMRVGFPEDDPGRLIDEIEAAAGPDVQEAPLDRLRRGFDAYFTGRARSMRAEPDLRLVRAPFSRRVLEATATIPWGRTATYGEVAADAGNPRAARAAGNALNGNPVPLVVPCHRIVPASGGIGGYAGHEERKAFLLRLEGAVRP